MKRFFRWFAVILLLALVGGFVAGYAPDTDAEAMKAKYAYGASRFVTLEPGLNVHIRDEGKPDGPVLVLIHGSNASLHTWEPWVTRLGADYRIISLDLPGHGLTGTDPTDSYTPDRYAAVIAKLLDHLKISKAVIGGNSMGGGVTLRFALGHPERVVGMLLVDAAGAPSAKPKSLPIGFRLMRTPVVRDLAKFIAPRQIFDASVRGSMSVQSGINDALIDRYWELNRFPGNRDATLKRFEQFSSQQPLSTKNLSGTAMPTLILWGEEDKLIPVSAGRWLADAITGAKLIVYPKVGHIPMEEIPDRSAADVKAWLDTIDRANWLAPQPK